MSWSELERLVGAAEADERLRRQFRRCHNSTELVRTARLLGYCITEADLRAARVKHAVERRRRVRPQPPRRQPVAS
jgi:predicted ribosomally synthesized peptide with nif11-like leader